MSGLPGKVRATRILIGATAACALASPAFAQQAAAPAAPPPTWTGSASAGLSLTSGNSDTANYTLGFDLTRGAKTRNVIKATGLYLRGEQNDTLAVNRTSLGLRDEYTRSGRTFFFGQAEYLRDTFKQIDYLMAVTGGVGYKVVDTEATKFGVDGGVGVVWEKNPGLDLRTNAAITAGQALEHKLTSTASIKQSLTGLWKANDFGDSLYTFSVGLSTRVSERLQLSLDLLDTFKNRPPTSSTKKNDVAFVATLKVKF